ncbi:MAG: KH domain-containing protein [Halobacteriota archaeon]
MVTQYVRIPQERIGVLIGHKGIVKDEIEQKSTSRICVDSENGAVSIEGVEGGDPVKTLRVADVISAIGRGFSPEKAVALIDDERLLFDLIPLDHLTPKALKRVKGRIIGQKGKTRRTIENLTGVKISIYGKTVSFIGLSYQIRVAHDVIEMLIKGAPHSAVYGFLERKMRTRVEEEW